MITRVTLKHFKRFAEETFDLADSMILAGPNNAGKSTLLQAIATWKLGLDRWTAQRKGGRAAKRAGVAITRADFTAVPLREMNLIWQDRRVSGGGEKAGQPRLMEIAVQGTQDGVPWECALEFQYANPELVYVRPRSAKQLSQKEMQGFPPDAAVDLAIVHVPPLSGIDRDEPRRDRGMQDLLVGQGRPGEILRNLLWETAQNRGKDWQALAGHVHELFRIQLRAPTYAASQPFITCEYDEPGHDRPLDLSNAGSGTLQVLLLFAFLYARPATVMLLDEPDAHQHVILQRQVYDLLRRVARDRNGQVILATHSEVVLDATEPSRVLGFFGRKPHALASEVDRDRLREALKRITTTDLLLAGDRGAILYVEGETDERILGEWARLLGHPAWAFLERPFVHWLGGRSLKEAHDHFFALRAAFPQIRATCLIDGDNRDQPDVETTGAGLVVLRWRRYEIENYLLRASAIKRFLGFPLLDTKVDEGFARLIPPGTDPFSDHVSLERIKASNEFIVPLLAELGHTTPKKDLYLLAAAMTPDEIHPEVIEKLDRIAAVLCPAPDEE